MFLKHRQTGLSLPVLIYQELDMFYEDEILHGCMIGFSDKEIAKRFGFYGSYDRDHLYRGFDKDTIKYVHPLLEVRDKGFYPAPGSVLDSYHHFNWVVLPTENFRLVHVESNSEGLAMLSTEEE